ncbi:DUF2599 domain-containing protein [Pseudomonas sp. S75]|uniref:DUF2599 domain-containing protein n=1 Tax=unclassified Pseudomonas TaxID=196821 RepID=UPI001903B9F8|nr:MULTISPECIES: DUF2599 domain-containing protein [unclassified Pseudomonas]MBJ9976453.1 DUF2599 domain-containing protein [Pseudomonas sp. S30]MBK0155647.1 DUF2599 domain-containing protein [Pseudomonas sp. S75]
MYTHSLAAALVLGLPTALGAAPIAVDTPQNTVRRINDNYNRLDNACKQPDGAPRGHYYCSGVTLRMVDDGPFNPWDYSPYALKTGATSFSWIRKDLSTSRLIRPAGFILRTPQDARALQAPVMETGFMCIYSFDGFTGPDRQAWGCGAFKQAAAAGRWSETRPEGYQQRSATTPANANAALAWGSCDLRKIDTPTQWRAQYSHLRPPALAPTSLNRIQVQQCSWNAEQAADWDAMIQVHEAPGTRHRDAFARKELLNEFLLRNDTHGASAEDGSARLPFIDAFVWDVHSTYVASTRGDTRKARPTVGLKPAQAFQRKLYAEGYAVPILRLDFTKPASQRFSYEPKDQVIALDDAALEPAPKPDPQTPQQQQQPGDLVASADWVERKPGELGMGRAEKSLLLKLAPGVKLSPANVDAIYEALEARYGDSPQWLHDEIHAGSMRAQLQCLAVRHPNASQWQLEPWRPVLSPAQMQSANCNPVRRLIESTRWSVLERDGQPLKAQGSEEPLFGLRVVPTSLGRQASTKQLYAELFRQEGLDPRWQEGAEASMELQLGCLLKLYNRKADWNLEPFRMATSVAQTEAAKCNP